MTVILTHFFRSIAFAAKEVIEIPKLKCPEVSRWAVVRLRLLLVAFVNIGLLIISNMRN
jgi:hypothetical protein